MTDLTPEEAMEMEWVRYWRGRAERAEAALRERVDIDLLTLERATRQGQALARVRAAVAQVPDSDDYEDEFMRGVNYARREIRAAVEGPVEGR